MMRRVPTPLRVLGASLVLCGVSACWGEKTVENLTAATYTKPANWTTECLGRWTVDVSGGINFGTVNAYRTSYKIDDAKEWGQGSFDIAGAELFESAPLRPKKGNPKEVDFEWSRKLIGDAYKRLARDKTGQQLDWINKTTKQLTTTEADAIAWVSANRYTVVFYREADQRDRRFSGVVENRAVNVDIDPVAAEKTAAQAQRVVDNIWPRYRVRIPGSIPTDAGICTPYGFFADPKGSTEQDYSFKMPLRSAQHNNLVLSISVGTRPTPKPPEEGESPEALAIEDMPTPWEIEDKYAKREKEKCRPQQGTASRDMFGCMFAGTKSITKHRDVEYLTLANGQKARLLVMEYSALGMLSGNTLYTVMLETAGVPNSVTEPRIRIEADAQSKDSESKVFNGKNPPSIDETVALVRTLALSMRPRSGAVADGAVVRDTLAGVR